MTSKKEKEIKRVNLRMGQSLHDWYQEEANALGLPTSSLMIFAMDEYRKKRQEAAID